MISWMEITNGTEKYKKLRELYQEFIYQGYRVEKKEDGIDVTYDFCIPNLAEFHPFWHFPTIYNEENEEDEEKKEALDKLFFSLGMVELISYWKVTCSPKVTISCGYLSKEQAVWWKKLYFHGLGEFFYVNHIDAKEQDFMELEYKEQKAAPVFLSKEDVKGCLVPIGGGKDSIVSLEILKHCKEMELTVFSVNRIKAVQEVIDLCQEKVGDIKVKRVLDKNLLELNKQGYLNGHTPFSAIVAFSSVITALLNGKRYIALSNETSANESTVKNSTVNHQYSKSFQFEQDFCWYLDTLVDTKIKYFSLLRPLTEIQIAKIFAVQAKRYHQAFRSCNAGSKQGIWCCNCPKCLFVYIILSPFLSKRELHTIFEQELLEKEEMDRYFRELTGIDENKPFECVGTRSEVLAALKYFIEQQSALKQELPLLVKRYQDFILDQGGNLKQLLKEFCDDHAVPDSFIEYVKQAIK